MLSDRVRRVGRVGGPCLESARWSDDEEEGGLYGEGGDVGRPSNDGNGTVTGLDFNGLNGGVA